MASFAQLALVAQTPEFQQRVQYAAAVAAIAVYNESPGTVGHAARAAFAVRVLNGQFNGFAMFNAVLTNATIAAEAIVQTPPAGNGIPDADIQFAVNSIWNVLAGA